MKSQKFPDVPCRTEAIKIWKKGILARRKIDNFPLELEYRFHTLGVAACCEKLAYCCDLDEEKAFVLGLLHDIGKSRSERQEKIFHGLEGYNQMMNMGYSKVAQICITHSFPSADFNDDNYLFYQKLGILPQIHEIMKQMQLDDYDYMVQLCDLFFEGLNKTNFENRFTGIMKRYNLSLENISDLYQNALKNKKYFDKKAYVNIYKILNI